MYTFSPIKPYHQSLSKLTATDHEKVNLFKIEQLITWCDFHPTLVLYNFTHFSVLSYFKLIYQNTLIILMNSSACWSSRCPSDLNLSAKSRKSLKEMRPSLSTSKMLWTVRILRRQNSDWNDNEDAC